MNGLTDIEDMNGYDLARLADCGQPDGSDSPGARLLCRVRDGVVEAIRQGSITLDDFDDNGQLHEIADGAPSVYTHARWTQFVDLTAYDEESESGDGWSGELTDIAGYALYQICDRLGHALCSQWREDWRCSVCGAEADTGCRPDACLNPAGPLVCLAIERLKDTAAQAPQVPADPYAGHPDYAGPDWQKPYETLPKAPVTVVEPLPIRTPGQALGETPEVLGDHRGPFPVAVTDDSGSQKLIFATGQDALAYGERMSRAVSPAYRATGVNWLAWVGLGLVLASATAVALIWAGVR